MNTYDERLHSTVIELLSGLELEQQKLQAQKNAALASHDQAQETLAAAKHRSGAINALLASQQSVIEKLQEPLFISTAILSSANEADACARNAVTNSSVAAANIQVATNAIVRLASDIGSLRALVQASDFNSELFKQAESINTLITNTAYAAETGSQLAMEVSRLTSEISVSAVVNNAKNTQAQAAYLMSLSLGQSNSSKEQQQAIVSELNAAMAQEKQAQQDLEKISAEYTASQEAYLFTVKRLGQEQTVPSNKRDTDHLMSKKEKDLHLLEAKVLRAQQKVDQHREKVTALNGKNVLKQEYLTIAETHKGQALNNKNLTDQLLMSLWDLRNNSDIAFNEAKAAKATSNEAAQNISTTLNQLVAVGEATDKFQELVIKKKAVNPLISDELINLAATICKDAANAISLGFVALTAAFQAVAGNTEMEALMALEDAQCVTLCKALTKEQDPEKALMAFKDVHSLIISDPSTKEQYLEKLNPLSLPANLYQSYNRFVAYYESAKTRHTDAIKELNAANAKLNTSQVTLTSLEAGLTAAKAAANFH